MLFQTVQTHKKTPHNAIIIIIIIYIMLIYRNKLFNWTRLIICLLLHVEKERNRGDLADPVPPGRKERCA